MLEAVETSPTENSEKLNLLGMSQQKLEAFFLELGEKKFRAAQVLKWIHQMGVSDFEDMTNISKNLREKLAERAEIRAPEVVQEDHGLVLPCCICQQCHGQVVGLMIAPGCRDFVSSLLAALSQP